MTLFCKICENILTSITTADSFWYKCNKCNQLYDINENDTLVYEESKGTNLNIYKIILDNAAYDPVNPKVMNKCKKCNYEMAKQVRLGDDMRLINICLKCKYYSLE